MKQELDLFGKLLVENVRDLTISTWYGVLSGQTNDIASKNVRKMLKDFDAEQLDVLRQIIPRIIDETIFEFLYLCENDDRVSLHLNSDGQNINLVDISDGLSGELVTEEGWIASFSEFPLFEDAQEI